jgi:hypothetical protein
MAGTALLSRLLGLKGWPRSTSQTKRSDLMLKRIFFAAAVTGLVAGASILVHTDPALAGKSGCREAAKAKFPGEFKSRMAYKKECKSHWKAMQSAHGKRGGLFKKAA